MTYQRFPIKGPWKGITSEIPPPGDPAIYDDIVNFLVKAGRIQTRPKFNNIIALPDNPPYAIAGFMDIFNLWHNLLLTSNKGYFSSNNPFAFNPLIASGGTAFPGFQNFLPYAVQETQNQVFFCNGSATLSYVTGGQDQFGNSIFIAGDVPGGCRFLELDGSGSHLLGAYWNEPAFATSGSGPVTGPGFPYRIRWSAAGNPLEWNSNTDITAGFVDRFDVANYITGLGTFGPVTYILHDKGILAMYNTGNGIAPFAFESISQGNVPKTNFYPYTLAKNDNVGVFAGKDDIYALTSSTSQSIGGLNRNFIMRDLGKSNNIYEPQAWMTSILNPSYPLRAYWLSIPGANSTWMFDFTYGLWERFSSSFGNPLAIGEVFLN